jgi:transcriptional regulator with PAS, ATPase and Fis domain
MPIPLPPLRERRGDIVPLASFFIDRFNREFRKRVRGLSPAAIATLEQYQWPGNVREMRNAIERAMLLIDREWLEPRTSPPSRAAWRPPSSGCRPKG